MAFLKIITTPKDGRRLVMMMIGPKELAILKSNRPLQFHGEALIPGMTSVEIAISWCPNTEEMAARIDAMDQKGGVEMARILMALSEVQQMPEESPDSIPKSTHRRQ